MKKLFSLVLALAMALALCVPALAVDDQKGTIEITNSNEGETYSIYKVMDLTYSTTGGKQNYAYTINSDFAGFFVKEVEDTSTDPVSTKKVPMTDAEAVAYVASKKGSEADFATELAAYVKANDIDAEKTIAYDAAGTKEENVDFGYYLMIPTMKEDEDGEPYGSALFSLDTLAPNVEIKNKSEYPTVEKTVNDTSVEIGQTVTYTVTTTVPNMAGYETYDYIISDTMGKGLTFNEDSLKATISVGGVSIDILGSSPENTEFTENGFEMSLRLSNYKNIPVGTPIVITYTATVNEDAIKTGNDGIANTATLKYSNNPNDSTKYTTTPPAVVEVFTAEIIIDKYDGAVADQTMKLAGAEFKLYKMVEDTKMYYIYDETNDQVSWDADITKATPKTTDKNGAATFIGLEAGTYYLVETKAPIGYNLLTTDTEIEVKANKENNVIVAQPDVTADVANMSGAELPSTGGMGTTLFYTVGGIMVLAAGILLVTKKRMSGAEE